MNKRHYQRELEELIRQNALEGRVPTLLLHSCCAPCSSYCLEYLSKHFEIKDLYYNPNISPREEYVTRAGELDRFIKEYSQKQAELGTEDFHKIEYIEGNYEPEKFYEAVKGHEKDPEGSERCFICYEMRLREAAEYAKRLGTEYFTTTLSISPLKNADKLNEIGGRLAKEYGVKYLYSDFKKKNGYQRSTELSKEYGLYRQNFCGCVFSKAEAMERQKNK